ncbi:hypothetical protein [Gemmatimonas phototrophica]|nr:hypothetical protein [Gemmatimonas phototrophica]
MRLAVLTSVAFTVVVAAACSEERAITTEPIGARGFGQNLIKSQSNLPRGRAIFPTSPIASANPAADSIIVELGGLDSLSGGNYVVWVGNDSATKFVRATGTLTVLRTDTTLNAQGDPVFTTTSASLGTVNQFSTGGSNRLMRFATTRAAIGMTNADSANLVLVSVETGTAGATPGTRRPLWARRSQSAAVGGRITGGLRFGNYNSRLASEYVFATSTAANAAFGPAAFSASTLIIPRGRIEVRGAIYTVNDSNYYRPPVGYYYEAWTIRTDTLGRFIDTVSLGHKATPFPGRLSFFDADTQITDPQYMFGTPSPVIFASQHRVSSDSIPAAVVNGTPWREFAWTYVTLQNKLSPAGRMGANVVMLVNNPSSISFR